MTEQTMRERIDEITQRLLPPEYFAAERVNRQARQKLATMAPPPPVAAELDPFERGDISDEWIKQTIELDASQALSDKRRNVLLTLMTQARGRAQSIHQAAVPRILRAFDKELQDLLAEVEEVSDELGDAGTAQEAIANDVGPQWKRLTGLADEYADLRHAQEKLMPPTVLFDAKAPFGEEHASDLYLANLDDLWPNWRNPGQSRDQVINIDGRQHRREPWPIDRTEMMLWLVRSDAQPWTPSEQQLNRLREDRIARANPMPKVIHGRPDKINTKESTSA